MEYLNVCITAYNKWNIWMYVLLPIISGILECMYYLSIISWILECMYYLSMISGIL